MQARWVSTLMRSLRAAGVEDVVLSPGSRSTPMVLALEEALRVHVVVDERAAGFFALGLARATGRAPMLLCTSGTAAAHYLPAVMEASASFVPLLVVSADRPPELHGARANQTIDQRRLFGVHARESIDLGVAGSELGLRAAARRAAEAVHRTLHPTPGPVHLNVALRKPFEERAEGEARPMRIVAPETRPSEAAVSTLAEALSSAERPAIALGPARAGEAAPREALDVLAARGVAILADVTSGHRGRLGGFDAILGELAPDVVVQLGDPPIGSAWARFLEAAAPRLLLAHEHAIPDPTRQAEALVVASPAEVAWALSRCALDVPSAWAKRQVELAARLDAARAAAQSAVPWSDARVAREAIAALPAGGSLVLGNSLAVRMADVWGDGVDARVFHQRGVSGIDGTVAGAAGVARASGAPTLGLLGDVAMLHDAGGLACARRLEVPLVLVVIHNGGGRIFERLPIHGTPGARFEERFATAHETDFAPLAESYGHRHVAVSDAASLRDASNTAFGSSGVTLVEARVPPDAARRIDAALREELSG